jgi:hypothetical protein
LRWKRRPLFAGRSEGGLLVEGKGAESDSLAPQEINGSLAGQRISGEQKVQGIGERLELVSGVRPKAGKIRH